MVQEAKGHLQRKNDQTLTKMQAQARRSIDWITSQYLKLTEELIKTEMLEARLHKVTDLALRLTNSHHSSLLLLDTTGRKLVHVAHTGPADRLNVTAPLSMERGVEGWVASNAKPLLTNDVASDQRFVAHSEQVWIPSAMMAVPLLTTKECIGVLNVLRRSKTVYKLGDLDLLRLLAQLSAPYLEIARLKRISESDPLTLLQNRRHFERRLPYEIQHAIKKSWPLSIAMLDLDHFKRINDNHGHDTGDRVLCELAKRLRQQSRTSDVLVRWGGEEFFAIFPDTNCQQATNIAERIRHSVSECPFLTATGPLQVRVSIGIAQWENNETVESLLHRVDQALYTAKNQGRDRVVIAAPYRPATAQTSRNSAHP